MLANLSQNVTSKPRSQPSSEDAALNASVAFAQHMFVAFRH